MTDSKTIARAEIEKLVRYFEQNIHQLKAPDFNEAQARQFLIDPFFEALGWDISNKAMVPPFRLEVLPEGRVKTSIGKGGKDLTSMFPTGVGVKEEMQEYSSMLEYIADDEYKAEHKMASKKPDYRFRIQGSTKFFVEAKKPSVDLTNHDAVFQIKRYGFSARVPVSILTDFEDFRVFDCTRKPFYDRPKVGVLKEFDLTYSSYLDAFDLLYDTFSREAVIGGSIEALQKKYLEKKKGEFALDRAFLDDLSEWRVELAQDIAKHPKNRRVLNSFTLNECVQRILDRIVFLRVVQDRNIDPDEELLALIRLWDSHPGLSLYEMFNKLIEKKRPLYNGLLFAEHECETLEVGNNILEKIFKNINYPLSPYNFDEIGVEILGSIYERFLGKTIRLTQKQVRVEEKPEVRKAGGVYYTPQYIVNYIVENTVGRLLYDLTPSSGHPSPNRRGDGGEVGKMKLTPRQVSKLKIIDIACGSGSFLLGAFQKLIDYHEQWYAQHPGEVKEVHGVRDVYEDSLGRLILSARKKREILVNNIYGVDIDAQAVEVTQMSLYLKVLENENDATLNKPTMLALHEVLLPPLKNNIKCGNSLIGTDIGAQGNLFDSDATHKINPFDWKTEFKEIMDAGGFDCVIGNPPYLFITELDQLQKDYFFKSFETTEYRFDVYGLFIELSLKRLLRENGFLSFIIPHTLLSNDSFEKLRRLVLKESLLRMVVDIGPGVFDGAKNETMILVAQKNSRGSGANKTEVISTTSRIFPEPTKTFVVLQRTWLERPSAAWLVNVSASDMNLVSKIEKVKQSLGDFCTVNQGLRTGDNKKYLSTVSKSGKWKPTVGGKEVGRYEPLGHGLFVYYEPKVLDAPRRRDIFESSEKIVVQEIRNITLPRRLIATYDENKFYCLQSTNVINLREGISNPSLKFLLGLLNSNAANYFFRQRFSGNNHIASNQLEKIPIPICDQMVHDSMTRLVEKMLDLHKQLQKASFDSEKEPIQRQIEATDRKIDELVYKLYELTEEEIAIVEGRESGVDQKWEASFASSQEKLVELAGKALKEYKSGKTKKMGFDEL